jgi:hypothetical protein
VGAESIRQLMHAVDSSIPAPERLVDQPFAMPIEDVFNIQVPNLPTSVRNINIWAMCLVFTSVTVSKPYMTHCWI